MAHCRVPVHRAMKSPVAVPMAMATAEDLDQDAAQALQAPFRVRSTVELVSGKAEAILVPARWAFGIGQQGLMAGLSIEGTTISRIERRRHRACPGRCAPHQLGAPEAATLSTPRPSAARRQPAGEDPAGADDAVVTLAGRDSMPGPIPGRLVGVSAS